MLRQKFIAAIVACTLITSTGAASAESLPFSFGFQTEDGFGISLGQRGMTLNFPNITGGGHSTGFNPGYARPQHSNYNRCSGPRSAIDVVYRNGFQNAAVYENRGNMVVVQADYRRMPHYVVVDTCRHAIVQKLPIIDTYENPRSRW